MYAQHCISKGAQGRTASYQIPVESLLSMAHIFQDFNLHSLLYFLLFPLNADLHVQEYTHVRLRREDSVPSI